MNNLKNFRKSMDYKKKKEIVEDLKIKDWEGKKKYGKQSKKH